MSKVKKLVGTNVSLGPIDKSDSKLWTEWLNDIEVSLPLGDEAYNTINELNQSNLIETFTNNNDLHVFTIIKNLEDKKIGRCIIFNMDRVNRHAMVGIFIGHKGNWNKGYGTEAMKLLLDYCFNFINLNSVMLGVMEFNKGAIKSYEKVGFKEIGRRRQARIVGNRKFDVIFMDILADEFSESIIDKYIK